jgi:exonuclease SbcC
MKILKIELQNINSLKSDNPIVIDFESDAFSDVGLFAITGSTGAGKTTILDAVTIAMYHTVPRFNRSNSQGKLEDIVSYGAGEAMARVTFANNGIRYEAFWSMRLKSKTGKILTNVKEEVRLKNLDDEKILAEKKKQCIVEIENITQLNYNQFLRSVMLAQGEFAAFLTANASEKGALLEQITGEDIYKKIGEAVNRKISGEAKKLETISAKINSEDLLSAEACQVLENETAELKSKSETLAKDFNAVEVIINWFKKTEELLKTELQLTKDANDLIQAKERQKKLLSLLDLHEQAEPYKTSVEALRRTEKTLSEDNATSALLVKDLATISTTLKSIKSRHQQCSEKVIKEEKTLSQWLPKLEKVTRLDSERVHCQSSVDQSELKVKELKKVIEQLVKVSVQQGAERKKQLDKLTTLEKFLQKNKKMVEIEQYLTDWNSTLLLRANSWNSITEERKLIATHEVKAKTLANKFAKSKKLAEQANAKLETLKTENDKLTASLQQVDVAKLLNAQHEQENCRNNLNKLHALSKDYSGLNADIDKLKLTQQGFGKKRAELDENLVNLKQQIASAEKSLNDAVTILEQERTIVSLAEERQKLQAGQPCSLCGAVEHPLVEQYRQIEPSTTKLELDRRSKLLAELKDAEQQIVIKLAKLKTEATLNAQQLEKLQQSRENIENKFIDTKSQFKLNETEVIELAMQTATKELANIAKQLQNSQRLQQKKDQAGLLLSKELKQVTKLNSEIIQLEEQQRAVTITVTSSQTKLKQLLSEVEQSEAILSEKLALFDLDLPSVEQSEQFIEQLKARITEFNRKGKEQVEVKNRLAQLKIALQNSETQLKEKNNELEQVVADGQKLKDKLRTLSAKRALLLPLKITTEQQRNSLQQLVKEAQEHLAQVGQELDKMKTLQTQKITEQANIEKRQVESQQLLSKSLAELTAKLKSTVFDSVDEVEVALLNRELQQEYTEVRQKLTRRTIELKTLKTKLDKELTVQQENRTFKISAEEAIAQHELLKIEQQKIAERMGEIRQHFELDKQIKARNATVIEEINIQQKIVKKWQDLMSLLGGSKNAFNIYVQRLTLQNLIQLANHHLDKINPRYLLVMNKTYTDKNALNFRLIDHFQADASRLVDTSSGGEKFLISLALALGLSDLASNNVSVESLFIDEGFGTLDNSTLETVISTLETLQAQGKMIGVISHVENLKERISTQIQITKKGNGISEVTVV